MKKLWLLALPYVVVASTEMPNLYTMKTGTTVIFSSYEKGFIDDVAEALNAAHEKRMYGAGKPAEFTSECGGPGQEKCQ